MIDLHTHTTESDGTSTPEQLVEEAVAAGLKALAICDHDTFGGYERAAPLAARRGLELICGIEISTRHPETGRPRGRSVHLLAYFFNGGVPSALRAWLADLQRSRFDRNRRLSERLAELGLDVPLAEVVSLGRKLAGRPHFARVMVARGYVASVQEAFDRYLDESAPAYVRREEPSTVEAIARVRAAGGVTSIAHPVRLAGGDRVREEEMIAAFHAAGLQALEVHHSDHAPDDVARYAAIAQRLGLAPSGGSDYHGTVKPAVRLGSGRGNVRTPALLLEGLRRLAG